MFAIILNVIVAVIGVITIGCAVWEFIKNRGKWKFAYITMGIILITLSMSFSIIPTGYTGVRSTFGQIGNSVLQNGFNFKIPFVQNIKTLNNKQQDKFFKEEIWGESSEKTEVLVSDITVTYKINSKKTVYIYKSITNPKENLIEQTIVNSAVKSATVKLPTTQVTNRNMIEKTAKETLQSALDEKYEPKTIYVLKVTIDNMDFTKEYNAAIAEKLIAKQKAEQQQVENQKAIDKAAAEKEKARIEAETKQIRAEADAEALRKSADAEAYAYRVKSAEITDSLLKKWEMDARIAHGWVTVQGAGAILTEKE